MSEKEKQNNQSSTEYITAIELAEAVIETTSTLIPIVSQLDGDEETKRKIEYALALLQKKALTYAIQVAKRKQARRNYWRRGGGTWRRK